MSTVTLTEAGRAFALAQAPKSIVARIALGYGIGWPDHYVRTAIEACNDLGKNVAIQRVY